MKNYKKLAFSQRYQIENLLQAGVCQEYKLFKKNKSEIFLDIYVVLKTELSI